MSKATVFAHPANKGDIWVIATPATFRLQPGESVTIPNEDIVSISADEHSRYTKEERQ